MLFHLIEPLLKCSNTLLPEIVDCHKNGKYRPISIKRILFYCYSVTICIRILFASLYSNNHEKYEFIGKYQHDQYVYWIGTIKANTNSTMLGYSIIPLISLTIYFDYLIYVRPNKYIWSLVYHLMLENSQDFFQLNSQFFTDLTNKWITNPIKSIRANARLLPTIWNAKKAQFSSEYLSHIPNLNPQVRIRSILIMKIHERFEVMFQLFTGSSNIYYVITLIHEYYKTGMFNWFQLFLISIDLSITLYIVWRTIILNIFALYCMIIGCFIYGNHLNYLNKKLTRTITMWKKGKLSQELLTTRTLFFRREHSIMLCDTIISNKAVVALTMLVCAIVMFLSTVCLFSMLIFYRLSAKTKFGIINIILIEITCFTIALIPQMMAVQQMYQSDPLVYKLLQYFQSKRFLLEKIKLANYYELLHTDKKEYFTIGELAKVNMQTIIQVILKLKPTYQSLKNFLF